MTKKLQVVARTEGFRRAGFVFGAEPKILIVDELKEEQIAALKTEPNLIVVEYTGDKPGGAAPTDNKEATKAVAAAEARAAEAEKRASQL